MLVLTLWGRALSVIRAPQTDKVGVYCLWLQMLIPLNTYRETNWYVEFIGSIPSCFQFYSYNHTHQFETDDVGM